MSYRNSTLWTLAAAQYGGLVPAAAAIGINPNTLYRAAHGCTVSAKTRVKIEAAFGVSLDTLQKPIADVAAGEAQ